MLAFFQHSRSPVATGIALSLLTIGVAYLVRGTVGQAAEPAVATPVGGGSAWATVGATAFTPTLPLAPEVLKVLAQRDHAAAVTALNAVDAKQLPGAQAANLSFLRAWELQRAGRGSEAVTLLDVIPKATDVPAPYADLVTGEILLAAGRATDAIAPLERVIGAGPIEVRARLALADAYQQTSRTADARRVWSELVARPDPSPGSSEALWALAQKDGLSSSQSKVWMERIYRYYPGSAEDRKVVWPTPSLEDLAARGDILQERGAYAGAKDLLDDRLAEVPNNTVTGCTYRFAYGRAQHKLSNVTDAAAVLTPLGASCKGIDDDRGAKALYIAGKSLERKKDWGGAAAAYALIPKNYPSHSMADDGYALGGIGRQQAGDLPGARKLWTAGFEAYPEGDLAGETAWRLAWGAWLAGDVPEALRWTDACAAKVPLASNPTDVLGCRYWAARWRAFPNPKDPSAKNPDAAVLAEAVAGFDALARQEGWHYYAILAVARLNQLVPDHAVIPRPPMDPADAPWQVRDSWLHSTAIQNAMGLVRVGLIGDAMVEFAQWDDDDLTGSEMAIVTGAQTAGGDFLMAHDRLRAYLKTHPPSALGPNAWKVMRQAYPEIWWPEVKVATAGYSWDGRLFHGLVREESNFNKAIKSHAGACGLSQLMPTTASGVAKRMGLSYSSADIWKPEVNLKIGAYYLNGLHARYHNDSALTLAAYNAGEGNVDKWLALTPNAPLDEVVEAIPFRETRMYVKRVSSSWQTYRTLYGSGALFVDWSDFMTDAVPE
jgi:soluble lytic murein transglycosylase